MNRVQLWSSATGNTAFRENTLENFCAVTDAGKPPKMTVCKANGDKLIGTLIN